MKNLIFVIFPYFQLHGLMKRVSVVRAPTITLLDHNIMNVLMYKPNAGCGRPQGGGRPHADKGGVKKAFFFADVLYGRPLSPLDHSPKTQP
jgi:hypothetical protein